jgi:hypothetical protein
MQILRLTSIVTGLLLVSAMVAMAGAPTLRAFAQKQPAVPHVEQVSGKYVNSDAGLEIMLPDGWSGMASLYGNYASAIAAPGGIAGITQTPEAMMVVSIVTKNSTAEKSLPDSAKQPPTIQQGQKPDCKEPSVSQVTINGMRGDVVTVECTMEGKVWKIKNYYFQTEERFVGVSLVSTSDAAYDKNIGAFDDSAHTLKVANTIEAPGLPSSTVPVAVELKIHKEKVHLASGNKDIDLSFDSSSDITQFKFDENNKKIMFKVSGTDGTQGTTVLHVGSLLKGPYTVTFDGNMMTDFETHTDQTTGDTTITLHYHHSSHDVTVSGTEVVPEFPVPVLGAIAAVIGVVAVMGRTKMFRAF